MTFTPAPGWCVVRLTQTAESYAGSKLVIPETVRDRVARNQVEIVGLPKTGSICRDTDCERPHTEHTPLDVRHTLPKALQTGSWCLTEPRSLVALPDTHDQYLMSLDAIWAILEG